MATEIKAIKCPQCGSTDKTALGGNHYQCKKCGTEYFLDDDDININHNINYPANSNNIFQKKRAKIIGYAALAWVAIMLFFVFIPSLFHNGNSSSTANYSVFGKEPVKDKWDRTASTIYETADGKTIYFVVGLRDTTGTLENDGHYYAGFYDATTGKKINIQKLDATATRITENGACRRFEDSNLYFIVNKNTLYKVDRQYNTAMEVTQDFFQNQPDLQSGIAQIEFVYEDYGDGFKIMTNDGKERYFYPLINKVYNKDQQFNSYGHGADYPENVPMQTGFTFTSKSTDYPEEKIQLIKYQYKIPVGYPRTSPRFQWVKDYGFRGTGIFTYNENDPHKKVLYCGMSNKIIMNPTDFTPGRMYFDAGVLTGDDKTVLIKFRATAADNAPLSIQLLDAGTAQILWTYPIDDNLYLYGAQKTKQGYFVNGNIYDLFIDNNGKLIKKLETDSLE